MMPRPSGLSALVIAGLYISAAGVFTAGRR
jgi:hypothetical protein